MFEGVVGLRDADGVGGGGTSVQVGAELPTTTVSRSASNTAESEDGDLVDEISPTHSHSAAYQINGHFKWRGGATRRRIFHSRNEFPAVSEKNRRPPLPPRHPIPPSSTCFVTCLRNP